MKKNKIKEAIVLNQEDWGSFYKDHGGKLLSPNFYDSIIVNMTKKFKS